MGAEYDLDLLQNAMNSSIGEKTYMYKMSG